MHTEYPHNISEETALLAASKLYSYLKNDTSISFSDEEIRKAIHATQVMIDIHLKHLVTLRTTCDLNQIIKQNDIRFLENKLVRLFSQQLITRRRFIEWDDIYELRNIALLDDWLKVIGLDSRCKQIFLDQFDDIEDFLRIDDDKLTEIILIGHELSKEESNNVQALHKTSQMDELIKQARDDSNPRSVTPTSLYDLLSPSSTLIIQVAQNVRRLQRAQKCFRLCLGCLEGEELSHTKELYWDSWDLWLKKSKINGFKTKRKASLDNGLGKLMLQPLPPLHRGSQHQVGNKLSSAQSAQSSKSTGSSPLSPPPVVSGSGGGGGGRANPSHLSASSMIASNLYAQPSNAESSVCGSNQSLRRCTPPPTPPVTHHKRSFLSSSLIFSYSRKNSDTKFPSTPPATRRHGTNILDLFPLTKSKSHEEQLSHRIEPMDAVLTNKLWKKYNFMPFASKSKKQTNSLDNLPHLQPAYRRRLATEPGSLGSTSPILSSSNCSSPISPDTQTDTAASECFTENNSSSAQSPHSSKASHFHPVYHRFVTTMKINITCYVCDKQMFIGLKCRECKFYVHRDCSLRVPKLCGLPREYCNVYKHCVEKESRSSSVSSHKSLSSLSFSSLHRSKNNFVHMNSNVRSCSNPSSPAIFTPYSSNSISPTLSNSIANSQFTFPPEFVASSEGSLTLDDSTSKNISTIHEEDETQKIPTIQLTTSGESSVDSDKTLTDSQNGEDTPATEANENGPQWPRQNSTREWDIPYDDLIVEEEIGVGRFGKVFRGQWHGSVAIKRIDMANNKADDRLTIETFKREVATFRKTRHDNLILFMGACMKPPHLAIVTEFCKGQTLHTHIHGRRDRFNFNRSILIAEQICLGMGYLHARGIIHKDLKTKNIFYQNGKVVITDFGLSSVSKFCATDKRGDWLTVPKGWLCYLAPEIIRTLNIESNETDTLPFSIKTDVYAFGTVWHELLFGCWPFTGQPSEVIIWQIGKGVKQSLNFQQASKEIKDLLYLCWAFEHDKRPDFRELYDLFQKLPKKRLQRSPSHPLHLQQTPEQHV